MDDRELIEQIKIRNQDAMVQLYQRYMDLIYSIAYRVLDEEASAEECVQDTFLKAWQSITQFDSARGPLIAWLIGIARNLAIDRLRQWSRRPPSSDGPSLEDEDNMFSLPDDWQDRERADNVRAALRTLPPEQIMVIELSYFGGMTQADIAEYLTIPLGTVKTRMRLGMQKLRDLWLHD